MISSVNALSTSSISLLFGTSDADASTQTSAGAAMSGSQPSGNSDDVFKAGNAIGKIIEIVTGMKTAEADASAGFFTMEGAIRTEGMDGSYSLTKTGTGKAGPDNLYLDRAMASLKEKAAGSGARAEWARTFLDAMKHGTISKYDMSSMGVTSSMTERQTFNPDGSMSGSSNRWDTRGMDTFLEQYVEIRDGAMYDRATGKHASISQNGTVFTYLIW